MPFMTWVKTPNGYKPVEITDEEMVAENARRRGKRAEIWLDEANEMVKREKEKKMEFDKSRVYTSLNADELKQGDKVITALCMADLRALVESNAEPSVIEVIQDETNTYRFTCNRQNKDMANWRYDVPLAYLIARAENCTNCGKHEDCGFVQNQSRFANLNRCEDWKPKTKPKADEICINCEHYSTGYCNKYYKSTRYDNTCPDFLLDKPKTEPQYRPFRDTDELIKVWDAKIGTLNWGTNGDLTMPHIWVREKGCNKSADLITCYGSKGITVRGEGMYFDTLFTMFEFLDGTPCGVKE